MTQLNATYVERRDPQTGEIKTYKQVTGPDGTVHELLVRDRDVAARQADFHSSDDFLRNKYAEARARASVRNINHMQREFEATAINRVAVNYHPDVKQVTDANYMDLLQDPKFERLANYVDKLKVRDRGVWNGKWRRPLLAGEIGRIGQTIYVLEPGYGRAVAVGADIKSEGATDGHT